MCCSSGARIGSVELCTYLWCRFDHRSVVYFGDRSAAPAGLSLPVIAVWDHHVSPRSLASRAVLACFSGLFLDGLTSRVCVSSRAPSQGPLVPLRDTNHFKK